MTFEYDSVEIISFSFLPIGSRKKFYDTLYFWFFSVQESFDSYSCVGHPIMQMINNGKLSVFFIIRIMYATNIGQEMEIQLLVFFQKLQNFYVFFRFDFKGQYFV